MPKKETYTDLGKELMAVLKTREVEFRDFYLQKVRKDSILKKCWEFCFDKCLQDDPDKYYRKWLPLIHRGHISGDDLFHIKKCSETIPSDCVFYDALQSLTVIFAKAILDKGKAEKAGYVIPLDLFIEVKSTLYRIETDSGYKEICYFRYPDFIIENSESKNANGDISEDICLVFDIPLNDSDVQSLRNYFENYSVKRLQKSPSSSDITFGNKSLVPHKERDQRSASLHDYTVSIECNNKREILLNCSLAKKYGNLLKERIRYMGYSLKTVPDAIYKDALSNWQEAAQEIEIKFYELLSKFDPSKHGHLAGYLKSGLKNLPRDFYRKGSAEKRVPPQGIIEKAGDNEIEDTAGREIDNIHPDELSTDSVLFYNPLTKRPDEILSKMIYQEIINDLPPKTKEFAKIWENNFYKSDRELGEMMGITKAMVKKHKTYLRKKGAK